MKNLRFERLELLSSLERRARTFEFHPRLTVINGENDVGKSSVIKSLYWAFGTKSKMHPRWVKAQVKAHVTFTIDGERHSILRNGSTIALFDADGRVLLSTTSVTKGLGPAMARLLDFGLVFTNRDFEPETPPPAFAFLPFYVDQDWGWNQALESFDIRGQYANVRKAIIEFHSGIRPNEYYELQAEKRKIDMERAELLRDRAAVDKAVQKLGLDPTFTGLELTEQAHEDTIDRLLRRLHDLRVLRQRRAADLASIVDERAALKEQMDITELAMKELGQDFAWVSEIDEPEILCPTCGTRHQNDFAHRFSILDDREACRDFLLSGQIRLREMAARVADIEAAMAHADGLVADVTRVLDERRGELTLKDVIEAEGRRNAASLFTSQIDELTSEIDKRSTQIATVDRSLKALSDRKRKEQIETYYAQHMLAYLRELSVENIDLASASKIDRKIDDTGSDQPRAVLAYYLALMRTIYRFSSALTAPMVIDSPNQQDQDAKNVAAMIGLMFSSQPEGGQTILGTVSLHEQVVEGGAIITLTDKNSVLRAEEYEVSAARLKPFMDQM